MVKTKSGEQISTSEFIKRWGQGIKNVTTNPTPLEKTSIEKRATFIALIGLITCFVVLIIFRDQFFVSWFAYGLLLIFGGSIITTGLKYFGLREQKKFLLKLKKESELNVEEIKENE